MDSQGISKLRGCILSIWSDATKQNINTPMNQLSPVHEIVRPTGAYRIGFNGLKGLKAALEILSKDPIFESPLFAALSQRGN
jgi:hypothetical protein